MNEHIPDSSAVPAEKIQEGWLQLAKQNPEEKIIIPPKRDNDLPLHLIVKRRIVNEQKVQYKAYLDRQVAHQQDMKIDEWEDDNQVGTFYCSSISPAGEVSVTRARVLDVELRKRGIGTALYDFIEKDIRSIGGKGIEPDIGNLSDDAVEFWKKRRPEEGEEIEAKNAALRLKRS